jgi:3-phosphoshikimate 1-carboxyvinyltransferase
MEIKLKKVKSVLGEIEVPGDKSITHRSIMLSSLVKGGSVISNYLLSDDCSRTIEAFRKMGAEITVSGSSLYVKGVGLKLAEPRDGRYDIYTGNSGTTTRLLAGILAGQNFETVITGDESLSRRPMMRVIKPLLKMGVDIRSNGGLLPLTIKGGTAPLRAMSYKNDKSTAQVKSAVLFAGLYADGATTYVEPMKSRDHSERMLRAFGADIKVDGNSVTIYPARQLTARDIAVPGDISSAAFFIAAALIVPGSNLTIRNVGINPTRDGLIEVLKRMGADIALINTREISYEPVCDMIVKYSRLKAVNVDASLVPQMIDEIPIFVLIATQVQGVTRISGAAELKVKESDRIKAITSQFRKLGARVEALEDGFIINGDSRISIKGTFVDSFEDHRIAMTLAVASLIAEGETVIKNSHCIDISFPGFYDILRTVCS